MSWSRFDDNWSDKMRARGLSFQTRVHYMTLIQYCSRTNLFDGRIPLRDAQRLSDVDDPDACLAELTEQSLVTIRDAVVTLVEIAEHVPPPYLRDEERKAAQRERKATQRERAKRHAAGDHGLCLPGSECLVTRDVTRDVGTGQDGPRPKGATSEVGNPVANPSGFPSGRIFPLTPVPDDLCPQCAEQPGDCICAA